MSTSTTIVLIGLLVAAYITEANPMYVTIGVILIILGEVQERNKINKKKNWHLK